MTIARRERKQEKREKGRRESKQESSVSLCPSDFVPALDQIVLKLALPLEISPPVEPIAPSALAAMQRLVEIVAQLRSSAIGATAELSLPPEALTPYVLEEAQDVLDVLQWQSPCPITQDHSSHQSSLLSDQTLWQGYFCLSSLAPWLLWGTARSGDAVMQLLEGRTARLQTDRTWQTGILRLVPLLSVSTADLIYPIDLATGRIYTGGLVADRLLQFDSPLAQQPATVTDLLHRLNAEIQATTATIVPFLQSIPAELLMPYLPWQTGSLQLHYHLDFISNPHSPLPTLHSPLPTPSSPRLKFNDPTWLQQHQALITEQQLTSLLSGMTGTTGMTGTDQPLPSLPALVKSACQLSEQLQTGLALTSRCFVSEELSLDQLARRLHWGFIHSAYEVMQLLSGIPATVWSPESACKIGSLRCSIDLSLRTPDSEWRLDLATGHPPAANRSPLQVNAIVQSPESQWCAQPSLLEHLESTFWQQVYQAIPEVKLLLQGAEVDLLDQDQPWQPGVIQLQVRFEFQDEDSEQKALL